MDGSQCLNCVRSEIHNVLSTMRRNGRWASEERFIREIPSDYENPMIRSLKSLHDYLQPFEDINDVDAVAYLHPFLEVVAFPNTNGAMTGRALSSINKFLLYGAVTQESPRGREAINLAVASVVECKFEATNSYSDEVVLMQLLEVMVNLLRCPAGPFISDVNVWKMIETCYRLKSEKGTSQLLRNTAANSLTHLILTLFSRCSELITVEAVSDLEDKVLNFDGPPEVYFDTVIVNDATNQRARRKSEEGQVFNDDDFDEDDDADDDADKGKQRKTQQQQQQHVMSEYDPMLLEESHTMLNQQQQRTTIGPGALPSPPPPTLSRHHHPHQHPPIPPPSGMKLPVVEEEDPDEALYRMLQPIRFGNTGKSGDTNSMVPSASALGGGPHVVTESYGLPVLVKVLEFLSQMADPLTNNESTRVFALQLINIILESGGEALATSAPRKGSTNQMGFLMKESSPVITVLSGDLCKHLLQNSQSLDLSVLSLTLRVIFNLFNAMKGHLKVQLEVFLTSVHLRIAESPTSSYEQKELALESLLDFCREPALMLDLYTNYDCDFRCTNLFETLCRCLCRCSIPASVSMIAGLDFGDEEDGSGTYVSVSTEDFASNLETILSLSHDRMIQDGASAAGGEEGATGITVLQTLALEGVLAVIDSISRRCDPSLAQPVATNMLASLDKDNNEKSAAMATTPSSIQLTKMEEYRKRANPSPQIPDWDSTMDSDSASNTTQADGNNIDEEILWFESARERKANLLRERKRQKRRLLLASKQFNKQPTKQYWLDYAQDLGVLPTPVTPNDVAQFFLNTPGLDKTAVGDYISEDPTRKPFNNEVMKAYISSFNFKGVRIDRALRMLLESFRLPGESQKIDRLMEAFGNQVYEQNKLDRDGENNNGDDSEDAKKDTNSFAAEPPPQGEGKDEDDQIEQGDQKDGEGDDVGVQDDEDVVSMGVFRSADAAFIFAFSIIMLHTDLHNPGIPPHKKMKLEEFIRNNRNINEGENLPEELLTQVYNDIKQEEMRMLYDPHSHSTTVFSFDEGLGGADGAAPAPGNNLNSKGPTWDTVLRHSEVVDKASFTPKALGRLTFIRAGVHERDMYTILFDPSMQAISVMFEMTRDGKMAARALEGFRNLARSAVYFNMPIQFNRIMITLCQYFMRFFPACGEGNVTEYDLEGLVALRDATILSAQGGKRKVKLAATLARAEQYAAYLSCRALLTFRALLSLTKMYGDLMRESWRNFVQTLLIMHEQDFLPSSFVEVDDVVDSHGNRLPTAAAVNPGQPQHQQTSPSKSSATKQQASTMKKTGGRPSGGFFSTLTSFIWSEEDELDEVYLACKETVRETLSACRLNTVFSKASKSLREESLVLLLDALLVPLEDPSYTDGIAGGEGYDDAGTAFERNTVLCVELLTEVGLSNHERIALIWPILRRAYRQVFVNAGVIPEGDDDPSETDGIVQYTPPISPNTDAMATATKGKPDDSVTNPACVVENPVVGPSPRKLIIKARPNRVRKVGHCSMFAVERVAVNLLRISVHMLDHAAVLDSLLGTLGWMSEFDDETCARLASRIGTGLSTVLRIHAANIRSAREWRIVCQLIDRFSHFQDSVDAMWDIVQTIVQCGYVNRINMNLIVETINLFIRTDDRAAYPANSPISNNGSVASSSSNSNNVARWTVDRASSAVKLIFEISRQIFSRDPDFCQEAHDDNDDEDDQGKSERRKSMHSTGTNTSDLDDHTMMMGATLQKSHDGSIVVEQQNANLLPDRHKCWMILLMQLRYWFTDRRPEVAASATQCLQSALWSPPENVDPSKWTEIFEQVLFPLVEESARTKNEQTMIRAINLLTRTFLHNVSNLASTNEFHILWLRMITFMSKSLRNSEGSRESTLENLKNLMMVMHEEGLFAQVSQHAGQNVWELTWSIIEAEAPGVRSSIEETLKSLLVVEKQPPPANNPPPPKIERTSSTSSSQDESSRVQVV